MLLPFTISIVIVLVLVGVIYLFYDEILDGVVWLSQANARKQARIWKRIVEMKREQEEIKEKEYE